MKKYPILTGRIIFFIFILLLTTPTFADVVYLKNGNKLEADTKETEEGVWVGGVLFSRNEIEHIEKKEYTKHSTNKTAQFDACGAIQKHCHLAGIGGGVEEDRKSVV